MSFDSIAALLFQTLCTLALSAVHLGLWRQRRVPYHATWAAAWFVYALRLSFIVQRPKNESGFALIREEAAGRSVRYTTRA